MKTLKAVTIAVLAVASVALATASVFAYMNRPGYYTPNNGSSGTTGTYTANPNGGTPYGTYPYGTSTNGGYYGGMMGGRGMMGGGRGGCGMRSGYTYGAPYANPASATPLGIDTAVNIAQNYVTSTGNTNLEVSQVEEYTLNFYVMVKEKDTGIGAFELLIDKCSGVVSPEIGPNMMWNTKYGMHNGMMGWLTGAPANDTTLTADQAKANAQQYLDTYYVGTVVGDVQAFYGYYHVEVLQSGNVYGMLSVNSYTGQVWYHTWHGTFIQELQL